MFHFLENNFILCTHEKLHNNSNNSKLGGGNNDANWADRGYTTFTIDFDTEEWTSGPLLNHKRDVAGCAKLDSGLIVIAGGEGKNTIEMLKPGATSWVEGTNQ